MKNSYLEVTYRKGRPLAGYYDLPRQDAEKGVRTERAEGGFLADYSAGGRAIGTEIASPSRLDPSKFNRLLERLGQEPVDREDLAPVE